MKIAVTGATGFLGRYLLKEFLGFGFGCRCWYRPGSNRPSQHSTEDRLEWLPGSLQDPTSYSSLVEGCDAVVHAALDRPGERFIGSEGDILHFVETNLVGTIRLIETARSAHVSRFIFISTCAVYDQILDDRPLDEAHPLWPASHYGAHKAAIEAFIHSYGFGYGYPICSLRPTGIYGLAEPIAKSKWFGLVRDVVEGRKVICTHGGKEVHARDVARAAAILLTADESQITGHCFNCYDLYVSDFEVAAIAKAISGSSSVIEGRPTQPKHQIDTTRIRKLGMTFSGREALDNTIEQLVLSAGLS